MTKKQSRVPKALSTLYGQPPAGVQFEEYLLCDPVIDADADRVRALYAELKPKGSARDKAHLLFAWVRDKVRHSCDVGASEVPCSASEVLEAGHGLCFAKSHLLVALLRAASVPSGFGYQKLRTEGPESKFGLHGFVYFLDEQSQYFVPLDPRGNNNRVNTQFSVEAPQLAFKAKVGLGEATYLTVHPSPLPAIVEVLTASRCVEEALAQLPEDA